MSHPYARSRRVADLIRRELAQILQREAQDPRFQQLSITQVQLSRDLSFAKVYVSTRVPDDASEVVYSLNRASGFFRHTLANTVNMRSTPKLRFYIDDRIQCREQIEEIIAGEQQKFIDYCELEGYNEYEDNRD